MIVCPFLHCTFINTNFNLHFINICFKYTEKCTIKPNVMRILLGKNILSSK